MVRSSFKIKKADMNVLYAFLDIVSELVNVDIRAFKPKLSRTYNIDIEGPEDRVKEAERLISKFASKVGWQIE